VLRIPLLALILTILFAQTLAIENNLEREKLIPFFINFCPQISPIRYNAQDYIAVGSLKVQNFDNPLRQTF